ncbi:MAG: pyridoxal-dependent decarboxylase, partial [Vicinamibacteria bacterium]|nr:pyridoxal-dependent decarboxylase [Vicinamibacteria bacterium]
PRLRFYASEQAHSSVEKAGIVLGVGQRGLRKIPTDTAFRMDVAALEQAIAEDRRDGWRPFAVVATVGTTSTTSIDPVPAIADICEREKLWLHVDAAYGGSAAIVPEMRWVLAGCERADSLVTNPHKWLFVPIDLSALYTRRPEIMHAAFSLVPEYLKTPGTQPDVVNLMDYGVSLGRRFRALKLWMVMRHFGQSGLTAHLREHIRLAGELRAWIEADPRLEIMAPTPFSVVCFRAVWPGRSGPECDARNEKLMNTVNAQGDVFISHTRLCDRLVLRVAIGNIRTEERHVRRAFELIRDTAARMD